MNILLIHGWDYDNYNKRTNKKAWSNRSKFIKKLEKNNNVYYPDLPGFGLEKEPDAKKWTLNDYAKFIDDYVKDNDLKIDYVLGYSFGGAVAVTYKKLYNPDVKEILVSPALIRNDDRSKKFIKTPKFLAPLRNFLRDMYLIKVVKNEEMVYGTKFLRNTYQDIVRVNMLPTIEKMDSKDFKIIYGSEDNMVNPEKVVNTVNKDLKDQIEIIEGGGHNIGTTHTDEVVDKIYKFTKEK